VYSSLLADPRGRAVLGEGLRTIACWDCGFESCRPHGCLSLLSVVCGQVEVSDLGQLPVQRSPTVSGVIVMRRPWPALGCYARGGGEFYT
jgi:hypothetical protein